MEVHVSVKAETLWSIDLGPLGTFNFTNSFLQMLIVMGLIIFSGWLIARKASIDKPTKAQGVFEMVVEFLLNLVESAAGPRTGRRIFPLIGSLFIFIILANYSGLLPGVGTIECLELCGYEEAGEEEEEMQVRIGSVESASDSVMLASQQEDGENEEDGEGDGEQSEEGEGTEEGVVGEEEEKEEAPAPLLRAPNADLNMTLAMALIAFTTVQIAGVGAHGVVGRLKHMGDPPFMFPIELISEFSRIISLSFRLFGNIFAGEVLVGVMIAMSATILEKTKWLAVIFFGLPTIFLLLEVLFGFIQALIFSLLTLIYITLATAGHDDHGHVHEPGDAPAHEPVQPAQPVRAGTGAGD